MPSNVVQDARILFEHFPLYQQNLSNSELQNEMSKTPTFGQESKLFYFLSQMIRNTG